MLTLISEQKQTLGFTKPPFEEDICIKSVNVAEKNKGANEGLSEKLFTLPSEELHSNFIAKSVGIILKRAVFDGTNRENKVLEWQDPDHLKNSFDFKINAKSETENKLIDLISKIIKYSVKTGHPYFVNQLFSG